MKKDFGQYGDLLATYLKPQWGKSLILLLLLLLATGLQLISPQIVAYFIDVATGNAAKNNLTWAALLFIGVGVGQQIVSAFSTYLSADVGWTATNRLRADLTRHVLRLDMSFHNNIVPGQLIERIDGDITQISLFFSEFVIKVLGSGLLLVGVVIAMLAENWLVGLTLTIFVGLAFVVMNVIRNIAVSALTAERQADAELFGVIEERLAGIEDIRANGGGMYALRRFFEKSRNLYQKSQKAAVMRCLIWVVTMALFAVGVTIFLSFGAYLFQQKTISFGTVYLFFQYSMLLRNPIEQISRQLQELQKATASIGRVAQLRSVPVVIKGGVGAKLPNKALSVNFHNVSFGYNDVDLVLKQISFELKAGQVLGVLGRTGSGKSTLTRLLFRLYDPTGGVVRLSGVDTQMVSLSDLRSRIGMVTQEVQLFHATVRDNLTFFDSSIPEARILAVLHDLGLDEWLAKLPQGLDTRLEAGAGGLSAGEAQLLAFTRVFLKNPGLVILDEPSSRLDPATERRLEQAMQKLLQGRTGIIIAHRLGTVQRANQILVMEDGQVREFGQRETLAQDSRSRFYALLQAGELEPQAPKIKEFEDKEQELEEVIS